MIITALGLLLAERALNRVWRWSLVVLGAAVLWALYLRMRVTDPQVGHDITALDFPLRGLLSPSLNGSEFPVRIWPWAC